MSARAAPDSLQALGVSAPQVLDHARSMRGEFVDFVAGLARTESPTDHPDTQAAVQDQLVEAFADVGLASRYLSGRESGGHVFARPLDRDRGRPAQLMVGHTDTVWPLGTLSDMPVVEKDGRLYGPGVFDMKAGVTQMVFALRILRDMGLKPPATPVVFINSDEEIGSPESRSKIAHLSRRSCRAFVLEPSLGLEGRLKTARKGVGGFEITVTGRAAHAGLDPGGGASAIVELANIIQTLHVLNDNEWGTTVNVGVVDGGIRPNVVAPTARARVDVRVVTADDGERVTQAIRSLASSAADVKIDIQGGIMTPPLERTPRNRVLWQAAQHAGQALGMELDEALAGGGSDGNTTSQYTATLDGLGAVGDGAHAAHEHIEIDATVDRCALLAQLLMAPVA